MTKFCVRFALMVTYYMPHGVCMCKVLIINEKGFVGTVKEFPIWDGFVNNESK